MSACRRFLGRSAQRRRRCGPVLLRARARHAIRFGFLEIRITGPGVGVGPAAGVGSPGTGRAPAGGHPETDWIQPRVKRCSSPGTRNGCPRRARRSRLGSRSGAAGGSVFGNGRPVLKGQRRRDGPAGPRHRCGRPRRSSRSTRRPAVRASSQATPILRIRSWSRPIAAEGIHFVQVDGRRPRASRGSISGQKNP